MKCTNCSYVGALVGVLAFGLGADRAVAARVINSIQLNGGAAWQFDNGGNVTTPGAPVSVPPGATVAVSMTVTTSGGGTDINDWESTSWRIDTSPPGTTTCANTANFTSDGQHTTSFNITAPSSGGTFNAYFAAFSGNSCDAAIGGGPSPTVTLANAVTVHVITNPPLSRSCGLDVVLVLDVSGSIDPATELPLVRQAAHAFVNALLPTTPSEIALIKFSSGTTTLLGLSSDAVALNAAIEGITSTGGTTNWQAAIDAARGLLEGGADRDDSVHPDLIVIATDGQPTTSSGGDPLGDAIAAANTAKTSASSLPIRMVGVGIGLGSPPDPTFLSNLIAITGPTVSPPAPINENTEVLLGSFADLPAALHSLAVALCGGTISIQKIVDQDGNLGTTGDQVSSGPTVQGWAIATSVSGGSSMPTTGSTGSNGQTVFDISITNTTATVGLTETQQCGYQNIGGSCTGATNNGTFNAANHSIDGVVVGRQDIIHCTFYNSPTGVPAPPTIVSVDHSTFCAGQFPTITLSANGSGGTLHWFDNSCGGHEIGTGTPLVIPAPTQNTTYFARRESQFCSPTSCASATVTVNQNPAAPTMPAATPANICPGACSMLSAVVPNGITVDWFTGSCGGTPVPGGAGPSVCPPSTTTYYARARNAGTGCTSANCVSVTVTVGDTQNPMITTCPPAQSASADASCQAPVPNFVPGVMATDNCTPAGSLMITQSPTAGTLKNKSDSPVTVTITVKDQANNQTTCTTTFTITDDTAPMIAQCAPPQSASASTDGLCRAQVPDFRNGVIASDNCVPAGSLIKTQMPSPGSFVGVGIHTVTITVADGPAPPRNVASCDTTFTVTDDTNPSINNCPSNILQGTGQGLCTAVVSWTPPTASDNCAGVGILRTDNGPGSPNAGGTFPKGTTTVTYTATDAANHTATCSFTVTVFDNQDPHINNIPGNITVNTAAGLCTAVVSWTAPTVSDNCPGAMLSSNHNPGDTFPKGTTTVTYTATDASGRMSSSSFTVTVQDHEPPTIPCPPNITTNTDMGLSTAHVTWTAPTGASVTDNCPGPYTVVRIDAGPGSPGNSGDFPIGTTTVTYQVTDASGNTGTCSFMVTVNDVEGPTITCPNPISVNVGAGQCCAVVSWTDPTAHDNSGLPVAVMRTDNGPANGACFPVGTTTVTYKATDLSGNMATCSFQVTVTDNLPPVISCPGNIMKSTDPDICTAVASWQVPGCTDNCPNCNVSRTMGPPSGSTFPVGVTTIEYTATDASGNMAQCSFTVTVDDNENPSVISCPQNITVSNDQGQCSAVVSWTPPTCDDNCPGCTISRTAGPAPGSTFPVGMTMIEYTAMDAHGRNSTPCAFTITVNDTEKPSFTSCPEGVSVENDSGECGAIVTFTVSATDNCAAGAVVGAGVSVHCTPLESGEFFPVGTTAVTCTATDTAGNTETCLFSVTVNDTEPPTITCPHPPTTQPSDPDDCGTIVNFAAPTAQDNCPGVTAHCVPQSGSFFSVGTTTVTCSAIDGAQNETSCSFDVTVADTTPPIVICPNHISVPNTGDCGAVVSYEIGVSDNCSGGRQTQGFITVHCTPLESGSFFHLGDTPVTCTATDAAGNHASCSFVVTVTDPDTDNDGVGDCIDVCPGTPPNTPVDSHGCSCAQALEQVNPLDTDGDGIPDICDNCPHTPNADQADCDHDGVGDACANAPDCNHNGIPDSCDIASGHSHDCNHNGIPDECEIASNDTAPGGPFFCTSGCKPDCNHNGVPDECDPDQDHDGIPDDCDNCPTVFNPDQADSDGNKVGDLCEPQPPPPQTVPCNGSKGGPVNLLFSSGWLAPVCGPSCPIIGAVTLGGLITLRTGFRARRRRRNGTGRH